MRNAVLILTLTLPALVINLLAQKRDFLTPFEADQLREVQNPNERLQLYSTWAKQRMAEIEKIAGDPKPGRATFVHDLLEDYTKIIEAADMVAEDALRRKVTIEEGIGTYVDAEKDLLARLEKLRDSKPKDSARFEFVIQRQRVFTHNADRNADAQFFHRHIRVWPVLPEFLQHQRHACGGRRLCACARAEERRHGAHLGMELFRAGRQRRDQDALHAGAGKRTHLRDRHRRRDSQHHQSKGGSRY